VTLIRHAHVATAHRRKGRSGILLNQLLQQTRDRSWWVPGQQPPGRSSSTRQVTPAEKDRLLRTYWSIPEGQVETSIVLATASR
jgi:hypothetical protein